MVKTMHPTAIIVFIVITWINFQFWQFSRSISYSLDIVFVFGILQVSYRQAMSTQVLLEMF